MPQYTLFQLGSIILRSTHIQWKVKGLKPIGFKILPAASYQGTQKHVNKKCSPYRTSKEVQKAGNEEHSTH